LLREPLGGEVPFRIGEDPRRERGEALVPDHLRGQVRAHLALAAGAPQEHHLAVRHRHRDILAEIL